MLEPDYSNRFKKDLLLMKKRGFEMRKIFDVMMSLQNEEILPPNLRNHALTGRYKGFMECHIEPDWLLVYRIAQEERAIYFARTGTHSDLF